MRCIITTVAALLVLNIAFGQKPVGLHPITIAADPGISSLELSYNQSVIQSARAGKSPGSTKDPGEIQRPMKCTVVLHNDFSTAHNVWLAVYFPSDITMISHPSGASLGRRFSLLTVGVEDIPSKQINWNLSIGDMTAGQTLTKVFIFSRAANGTKVSAEIFNSAPDNNPNNNKKDASL